MFAGAFLNSADPAGAEYCRAVGGWRGTLRSLLSALLLCLVAGPSFGYVVAESRFDEGLDGWTGVDFTGDASAPPLSARAAPPAPAGRVFYDSDGGALRHHDAVGLDFIMAKAPEAFGGDYIRRGINRVTFDLFPVDVGQGSRPTGFPVLLVLQDVDVNGVVLNSAVTNLGSIPIGEWSTKSVSFKESSWIVQRGNWDTLIRNVDTLAILVDLDNQQEQTLLDNVVLDAVFRDQGRIFSTGGVVVADGDSLQQTITTGISGKLDTIRVQLEDPTFPVTLDLAVADGADPFFEDPLFSQRVTIEATDVTPARLFDWTVGGDLFFAEGDEFTLGIVSVGGPVTFAANDPPGYAGGALFRDGLPVGTPSDLAFVTFVEPVNAWRTTFDMSVNADSPESGEFEGIVRAEFLWSTLKSEGPVSAADLTDLVIELSDGDGVLLWRDIVIQDGEVLPFGGTNRSAADLFWDANLGDGSPGAGELRQFGNASNATIAASQGTQFQVGDSVSVPADGLLFLDVRRNGAVLETAIRDVDEQSTTRVVNDLLSEPADVFLLEDELIDPEFDTISFATVESDQATGAPTTLQFQAIHSQARVGQSFTVGTTGTLDAIELVLFELGTGGDLFVQVLDFSGGDPVTAPVLGGLSLTEDEVGDGAPQAVRVDLAPLGIEVRAGDELAVVLTSPRVDTATTQDLYAIQISRDDQHPGGTYFTWGGALATFGDATFDLFITSGSRFDAPLRYLQIAGLADDPQFDIMDLFGLSGPDLEYNTLPDADGRVEIDVLATGFSGDVRAVPITFYIDGVADPVNLDFEEFYDGFEGDTVELFIDAESSDPDGSEVVTVRIEGVPPFGDLFPGERDGDDWILQQEDLPNIFLDLGPYFFGELTLDVEVSAEEPTSGDTFLDFFSIDVFLEPFADGVDISLEPILFLNEDTSATLPLELNLFDPGETLIAALELALAPPGTVITDGSNVSTDAFTDISNWDQGAISVVPPPDYNGVFTATVFAFSEIAGFESDESSAAITIVVSPVNDPPEAVGELPDQTLEVGEERFISLAGLFDDIDGDPLFIEAFPDDPDVAEIDVDGDTAILNGNSPGTTTRAAPIRWKAISCSSTAVRPRTSTRIR